MRGKWTICVNIQPRIWLISDGKVRRRNRSFDWLTVFECMAGWLILVLTGKFWFMRFELVLYLYLCVSVSVSVCCVMMEGHLAEELEAFFSWVLLSWRWGTETKFYEDSEEKLSVDLISTSFVCLFVCVCSFRSIHRHGTTRFHLQDKTPRSPSKVVCSRRVACLFTRPVSGCQN